MQGVQGHLIATGCKPRNYLKELGTCRPIMRIELNSIYFITVLRNVLLHNARGVDPLPKLGVFKCVRLPDTLKPKPSSPFPSSPSVARKCNTVY